MSHETVLYVIIIVLGVLVAHATGRRVWAWIRQKDARMDEIQEAFIDAHAVFVEYGLKHAQAIAKRSGAISIKRVVEAVRDTVRAYSTPPKALLELDDCFGILLMKRANDPAWCTKTAKLILNEQSLVAELDRLAAEGELEKKKQAIIKKALGSAVISEAPPPA